MVILNEGNATEEIAYATGKSGGSLTIPLANRGLEGGSAQAHNSGESVKGVITAGMWNDLIDTVSEAFSKVTGKFVQLKDANGNEILKHTATSNAVNEFTIVNAATGNAPELQATGGDTNIDLKLIPKGTGALSVAGTTDYEDNVTDDDDIPNKKYVDDNSGSTDGWTEITDTLTYASAMSFTIAGVDRTSVYTPGTRIKLTQTSTKYFVVTSSSFSTDTTVNITGGTDYTLANAAITDPFYSYQLNPQGYPGYFSHTSTLTGFSGTPNQYSNKFAINGRACHWYVHFDGTSNAAGFTVTAPVAYGGVNSHTQPIIVNDNGSWQNNPGVLQTVAGSATFNIGKTISTIASGAYAGFTSSGNKGAAFHINYEI